MAKGGFAGTVLASAILSGAILAGPIQSQTPPATPAPSVPPSAPPTPIAPPTLSDFARLDFVESVKISPDGNRIAGIFGIGGRQVIMIHSLFDKAVKDAALAVPEKTEVDSISWVNDDNIILHLSALISVDAGDDWYVTRLLGVNRISGKATKLMWDLKGQNAGNVLKLPSDGSADIIMAGKIRSILAKNSGLPFIGLMPKRANIPKSKMAVILSWNGRLIGKASSVRV